jgi:hypothetical protein
MAMTAKVMEFEHSIIKYNYSTGLLTVQTRLASGSLSGPLEFNKNQIQELREGLAGIDQQVPIPELLSTLLRKT